jgi:hypothetical protein
MEIDNEMSNEIAQYVLAMLSRKRFFDDIYRVLRSRGGACDCEILFNVAGESRLRSDYWKGRAESTHPIATARRLDRAQMMLRGPDAQQRRIAVFYARVSSHEQAKEGFSIPAQEKLLRSYAVSNRLEIAAPFTDIETAKRAGRRNPDPVKSSSAGSKS